MAYVTITNSSEATYRRRTHIMTERPTPELVIPRDQIEILPADPALQRPADGRSGMWVSSDANGVNHRVYVMKPGPIGTILLALAFGAVLAVTLVLALGLLAVFAVLACISGIMAFGFLLYGRLRAYVSRTK